MSKRCHALKPPVPTSGCACTLRICRSICNKVLSSDCAHEMRRFVAKDEKSYQYLVESIRQFPPQDEFADMISEAGFTGVTYENLTGGVVAIHSGTKWH